MTHKYIHGAVLHRLPTTILVGKPQLLHNQEQPASFGQSVYIAAPTSCILILGSRELLGKVRESGVSG